MNIVLVWSVTLLCGAVSTYSATVNAGCPGQCVAIDGRSCPPGSKVSTSGCDKGRVCCLHQHSDIKTSSSQWVEGCGLSKYPDAGRTDPSLHVMGGVESRPNEFPWQARIHRLGSFVCGAFLIDAQWVVTAEHCMERQDDVRLWTVWLGSHMLSPPDGIELQPTALVRHPDYDTDSMVNDIAMFKLPYPVNFTENIRPACMPEPGNAYENVMITIAGWGTNQTNGVSPNTLHHVNVPVMDNPTCQLLAGTDKIFASNICHGGDQKDTGNGDSGGAYLYKDANGLFSAIGIVSWGYDPAGTPEYPGAGTRVSSFLDWIQYVRTNF